LETIPFKKDLIWQYNTEYGNLLDMVS
jgi:hypothetical protein